MASQDRPYVHGSGAGTANPTARIDQVSQTAWKDVQHTQANMTLDPATDPTHSHWIHKFHLANGPLFLKGRIVDSIAYTNCHKVQFVGYTSMWCKALSDTALQPIGSRDINQLPIGAGVLVMWFKDDREGIILGVIPDPQTNSAAAYPDFISQEGRSGLNVDAVHNYPVCLPRASLITDWSGGRPYDSTAEGESGKITETGLLTFIDSFMIANRVDESCGVWHFWHDQLTRIAAYNLHFWTAGCEREDKDDEGEFDKVEGHTPYYWEALGAFELGLNVHRTIDGQCWQHDPDLQGYNSIEPCADDQLPFYRLRDYYGYFGQAHKRVLCLLPQPGESSSSAGDPLKFVEECEVLESSSINPSSSCDTSNCTPTDLNTLSQKLIFPGVFEEDLALTGRWGMRSAHEIIISKYIAIPAPKQMKLAEDPTGDNSANYAAAGALGLGPPHIVNGEIAVAGADDPTQIRAAGFLDTHAFVFNWIGDHPFYYHVKDWYLPDEDDLLYIPALTPIDFDELACFQFLQAPASVPMYVDHRYGDVQYYPNHSYFGMLADGGVVLGDGFGSELKMANGQIWLTAPGDINFHAGRDVVSFAGYDLIMRAKNSFDISATNKDGRIKAHENLWLAATGECGGILLQSMAKATYKNFNGVTGEDATLGGIVIKAENSLLTLCSNDMSMMLTNTDTQEHVLVFDAGDMGRIKFRGQYHERFMMNNGAAFDFWADGTTVISGNEYWLDGSIFSQPVVINNKLLVDDCVIASGNLVSANGHVVTAMAANTHGQVGAFSNPATVAGYENLFTYYQNRNAWTLPGIGDLELITLTERQEDFCICDATFTYRSTPQYRTNDYVLFESRWQQLARLSGTPVKTWTEEAVGGTYPYPGTTAILGTTYRTLDPVLYNINNGRAVDRGALYENPTFNLPQQYVLNGTYTVII